LGAYFLKIDQVDPYEQIVTFTLKSGGVVLDQGYVTFEEPYVFADKIKIELVDFAQTYRYGMQARLRVSSWSDGRILQANVPEKFHIDNKYTIWANIKNTGAKDTLFQLVFTQVGQYLERSDMYRTPGGLLVPRFLDLESPQAYVRVPPGEEARIEFKHVIPNRAQTSLLGRPSYMKSADLVFYLLANGQLLDSYYIPSVQLTSVQSGFIADVFLPQVMVRDLVYTAEAVLHNAGPAQGGIESDKFYFEENSGATSMDPYRFEIPADSVLRYIFQIRPTKVGKQTFNFEFSLNRKILDTFSYEVDVVEGISSYIDEIRHAPEVKFGEDFDVDVIIKNLGPTRRVEVRLSSPVLDAPMKHVLTLNPESTVIKTFSLPAIGQGSTPLVVEVFSRETQQGTMKNYDPYADGEIIHKKESSIMIITPLVAGMQIQEPPKEDIIFKEPTPPEPKYPEPRYEEVVVYAEEEEPEEKPAPSISPAMAVIIVLLVILIFLIARIIWGPSERRFF